MSKYSVILSQVSFPHSSDEYSQIILGMVKRKENEAIRGNQTKKFSNIQFRLKDAVFATLDFLSKLPGGTMDLPGFITGLWEYVSKLNEYATYKLTQDEAMIVGYAALIYRDNSDCIWPTFGEVCQRLPDALEDNEFLAACEHLEKLGCIKMQDGRIVIIEEIDILEKKLG